jgi:hypothetical protein
VRTAGRRTVTGEVVTEVCRQYGLHGHGWWHNHCVMNRQGSGWKRRWLLCDEAAGIWLEAAMVTV